MRSRLLHRVAVTWFRISGGADCAVDAVGDDSKSWCAWLNQRVEDLIMGVGSLVRRQPVAASSPDQSDLGYRKENGTPPPTASKKLAVEIAAPHMSAIGIQRTFRD